LVTVFGGRDMVMFCPGWVSVVVHVVVL
jgi:hypothetical protein